MEQKSVEILKDFQKKAETEQETKDNLIQDLERYDRKNKILRLLSLAFNRIISENKVYFTVVENNLKKENEILMKVFTLNINQSLKNILGNGKGIFKI